MKILLIEDDLVLSDGLTHTLEQSGYAVTPATSAQAAETCLQHQDFDLLILDLGLPDMDGLDLLRRLRKRKLYLPILILTARDGVNDRVCGIEQGADDYLTKPFELRELEARIHGLIRRCYGGFNQKIQLGGLLIDTRSHQVLSGEEMLQLSEREYGLLEILLLQLGNVVCKERIAQRLAEHDDALSDNAVEIYIHRLRKRLEPYRINIRTVRGLGYLLEKPDAA
jgi:two-component system, OmpR family, response regulator